MKEDLVPLLKRNLIPTIFIAVIFLPPIIKSFIPRGITLKATDGSKINFKSENVSCKWSDLYYLPYGPGEKVRALWCNASGVRTYLNGYKANYSNDNMCRRVTESGIELEDVVGNLLNPKSFPCTAARKLGKY